MNELLVFWTHGFVVSVLVMLVLIGLCLIIPEDIEIPGGLRRRRIAAAAAVELDEEE